ncbi:MAG TPA: IS200/IS605 family transposase [Phycisphaerales bacterium]|nr:IS200/IS605 family transposase [Phycisphaerales bacterium]
MVAVGASPRKEWQQPASPEGASENTTMSYTWLKYHIVFSTKERRPFLTPELMPRLCEYLGGMIKTQGGHSIEINGPEDHIHIVASVSPTLALADCLRDLKPNSTNWIHETFPGLRDFAWQDGYSAFTVSPSVLSKVVQYVKNQQEHHKKVSFRDELAWLLKNHGIEFDEKYL